MRYYKIQTRIFSLSIIACLFLVIGMHSSFSQEELSEISDEDLDLLEEFLEQADDLLEEEN